MYRNYRKTYVLILRDRRRMKFEVRVFEANLRGAIDDLFLAYKFFLSRVPPADRLNLVFFVFSLYLFKLYVIDTYGAGKIFGIFVLSCAPVRN